MKITALVPLKTNSQRLPRKNFAMLAGKPLFIHIFETLLKVPMVDRIVCWSSDEIFIDYLPKGVEFVKRDKYLDGDDIKAKELFTAAAKQLETDYFVLTHATAPFISSTSISAGISAIFEGYDSSLSVKEVKNYCWYKEKPLNYELKSPAKTQDLDSIFYETSGFYIFHRDLMLNEGRRIGNNPKTISVTDLEAIDIDEKEDFELAKMLEAELYKKQHQDFILLQKKYRHLVLDMDGVMIDSVKLMKEAWKYSGGATFADFKEYQQLIGIPFKNICIKLNIPKDKIQTIEENYFKYTDERTDKVIPYPKVVETIRLIRESGIKISIVSSKKYNNVISILDYLKIDVDSVLAPGVENYTGRHKPSGDPLLYSCILVGESIHDSIFIGDMLSDYNSAKSAGMDFVFAAYGYGDLSNRLNISSISNFEQLKIIAL